MMVLKYVFAAFLLFFCVTPLLAQASPFTVLFYNVENLYDCEKDSLKDDGEFLPDGDKYWTFYRLNNKLKAISKVIIASNKWDLPAVVGLCEVENAAVLKHLLYSNGLYQLGYRFLHVDGPDKRGVDVALLYRKGVFTPLSYQSINVSNADMNLVTRDVLYVKGLSNQNDTLHFFINHWPSKLGGEMQSEPRREYVAHQLNLKVDSLLSLNNQANIIVMGDFNAEIGTSSISLLLGELVSRLFETASVTKMISEKIGGSHKYQGQWALIDHVFVSASIHRVLLTNNGFSQIVSLPFLLEDDPTYSGVKPYRTYVGPRYLGGVSDHLPVMLVLPPFTSQ